MAIDPRIALGVQPLQIQQQDPNASMNALARMMQVDSAMQQANHYQREMANENALNAAYKGALGPDGAVDRNALYRTLAERNLGSKIPGLQKTFLDADTAAATLEQKRGETADKAISRYRDQLSSVTNPQQAVQWIQAQHADPMVGKIVGRMGSLEQAIASIPQDPEGFARWRQENALGMTKFVEMNKPTLQKIDSGQAETIYSIPGMGGAPQVVTSVQKVMTPGEVSAAEDRKRARQQAEDHFNRTQAAGKLTYDSERGGVVNLQTREFMPATQGGQPVGPKDKALTEGQAKANLFGTRMREADRILSELTGKYSPMAVNAKMAAQELPVVGGAFGAMGNLTASAEGQQAEQAQRDFINAVLRRESGAVISPQEFANAKQQYFPQPNDKPANIAQKARNRALAISGLEAEVPGGFRVSPSLTSPGGNSGGSTGDFSTSPDVDALLKKYGGK